MRCSRLLMLATLVLLSTFAAAQIQAEDAKEPEKKASKKTEEKTAEQIRIYVEGAYCPGCTEVLKEALEISGLKNASKISANAGQGYVIVYGDFAHSADLSKVATAVNGAQTPHKKISKPGVSLELFGKLNEETAAQALKSLEKIKGVDAEGSTANAKRGVISVRLKGGDAVSVADIIAALEKDGISAKVETNTVKRFLVSPAKPEEEKQE